MDWVSQRQFPETGEPDPLMSSTAPMFTTRRDIARQGMLLNMSVENVGWDPSRINLLGGILVGLALVSVVVTYPPPASGLSLLLGNGNMFHGLFASIASLFLAVVGGVLLAPGFIQRGSERTHGLLARIIVPVIAAVVINAYLVIIAGYGPQSPLFIAAVLLAIILGIVAEIVG